MNKAENTLVILTPGFPESEADSTCLPLQQNLVRVIKETYPQLNIIILAFQYPYWKKNYLWHGILITAFNGRNKGGLSKLLLRQNINTILKEIYRTKTIIGLLSFWCGECALVAKRFAHKHSLTYFCWILGQDAKKENKYVHRIKPKPEELLALSDFIQEEFERNHNIRPAHVVTPGIDPRQFNNTAKEKDIDLLAVGSLIPLKQFDIFIETVAAIKKEMPHIKAVLAGDGPEKNKLQQLIIYRGLQSTISLTGELPYTEILALMQRTKILLHPSSYEGFVMVGLEALYGGAEVISFVKPMKKEISNWYQVSGKEEMAKKALAILSSPQIIHERTNCFTIKVTAKKLMQLFSEGI